MQYDKKRFTSALIYIFNIKRIILVVYQMLFDKKNNGFNQSVDCTANFDFITHTFQSFSVDSMNWIPVSCMPCIRYTWDKACEA